MAITFEVNNKELVLAYAPSMGIESIMNRLSTKEGVSIKHTFFVTKSLLREPSEDEYDFEDTIRFCVGEIEKDYVRIDSEVIGTKHHFYFSNDIVLKPEMFVAYRNISILRKIDKLIDRDFYIGGKWDEKGGISLETFRMLLDTFPKTAELDRYADSRISVILKDFFPQCDQYEGIFERFIEKKDLSNSKENRTTFSIANLKIEYEQFSVALAELEDLLSDADGIPESTWQEKIQNILQLLYPKYILCTREISFKGIDGYDKRPDFILVDNNGFVDILEIKKPGVPVLTKQASYRNNYVPVRDFAGAIQQIEKYIFCLTSLEKSQKAVLEKLGELLPTGITPEIVNPQGILLLGRSVYFNPQQKRDFELIKRQYKNIADIMTYDDLAQRLKNIISSLKQRI